MTQDRTAAGSISVLELRWTDRPIGEDQSPRRFLDYVIDGKPLFPRFEAEDYITRLLRTPSDSYLATIPALQLMPIPEEFAWYDELEDNRQALYVCPECGDLGCGAISAVIQREGEYFIWKDFAYYNTINYSLRDTDEPYRPAISTAGYEDIGPFVFEADQYTRTLQAALELISLQPTHV